MPVREVKMYQVYCCVCDVPGPIATASGRAAFDAITVGWEVMAFQLCLCPTCNEKGLLPPNVEDVRVTLPVAADVPAVVEASHDA